MGKRYAINIGVNQVSVHHYGSDYDFAPVRDNKNIMSHFLQEINCNDSEVYSPKSFETATSSWFKSILLQLSGHLQKGDTLVISFCGHTIVMNDEHDILNSYQRNKGWMLYDRVLFHFEIWELIKNFKSGVKIVIIADSCFTDDASLNQYSRSKNKEVSDQISVEYESGDVPYCFRTNKFLYDQLLDRDLNTKREIPPALIIISPSNPRTITEELTLINGSKKSYRTKFSRAFEEAFQKRKHYQNGMTWKDLFDETCWISMHNAIGPSIRRSSIDYQLENFEKTKDHLRKNSIPQWHYARGFEYTDIKTETL